MRNALGACIRDVDKFKTKTLRIFVVNRLDQWSAVELGQVRIGDYGSLSELHAS